MSKRRTAKNPARPIIRLRLLVCGILVTAAVISLPLLLVWKQVYITSASLRIERMNGALSGYNQEITRLTLVRQQLSSNDRIERIARSARGLDYPSTESIVVVRVPERSKMVLFGWPQELFALLKRSFSGERG